MSPKPSAAGCLPYDPDPIQGRADRIILEWLEWQDRVSEAFAEDIKKSREHIPAQ